MMKIKKVLNLYAGIGGNRRLWTGMDITSVELDPKISSVYHEFFPDDVLVVADAHQYLLDHYREFDFIWSSPPCPSHGQYRYNVGVKAKGYKALYPDMRLYEEIILLSHHFSGLYVVENVISYYPPLITPIKLGRHYIWCNFDVGEYSEPASNIRSKNKLSDFDVDLSMYNIPNKRQILRNQVSSNLGLYLLDCAVNGDRHGLSK